MPPLSFITSAIALSLYSVSYFFNNKRNYLIAQMIGNVVFSFSYLFLGAYFTMVSVIIGIARALVCFIYEKKDKSVPNLLVIGLCAITVLSYVIINYVILSQSSTWDFLYLIASCLYTITFAIRNLRIMRFVVTIPHISAIAYNILIKAPFTSAISYTIELSVTLVAIVKQEIQLHSKKRKSANA